MLNGHLFVEKNKAFWNGNWNSVSELLSYKCTNDCPTKSFQYSLVFQDNQEMKGFQQKRMKAMHPRTKLKDASMGISWEVGYGKLQQT